MFSEDMEKMQKIINLESDYIERVNRNVMKLTKQLENLNVMVEQLGGAAKKNVSKNETKAANKVEKQDKKIIKNEEKEESVQIKEASSSEGMSLVMQQAQQALLVAQLETLTKQLDGDVSKKLKKLAGAIESISQNKNLDAAISKVSKAATELDVPSAEVLSSSQMREIAKKAKEVAEKEMTQEKFFEFVKETVNKELKTSEKKLEKDSIEK